MMTPVSIPQPVQVQTVTAGADRQTYSVELPDYERDRFDDVAFMTAMNLCLMGNYAQTGHFGGPLAYTPYNVACHLAGPELGGLRYDLRDPSQGPRLDEALQLLKPSEKRGSKRTRGEEQQANAAKRAREQYRPEDLGMRAPSGKARAPPRARVRS